MSIRRRRRCCTFETFPWSPVRPYWRPTAGGGYLIWSNLQKYHQRQRTPALQPPSPSATSIFLFIPNVPFSSPPLAPICDVTYLRRTRIRPGAACWREREDGLFLFFVLSSEPPQNLEISCQILNQTLFLYRKKKNNEQVNWFLGANRQDFWVSRSLAPVCSFTPLPQWLTDSLTEHLASPFLGSGSVWMRGSGGRQGRQEVLPAEQLT